MVSVREEIKANEKVEYIQADYDPCREWCRVFAATVSLIGAVVAAYPIQVGVACFLDRDKDDVIDLTTCDNLLEIRYSLSLVAGAVLVEVVMLLLFFYSCRHEFCCVIRHYDLPLCGKKETRKSKRSKRRKKKKQGVTPYNVSDV